VSANRYKSFCCDCGKDVEAGEGRLYRYSGANRNKRPSNCCGHRRLNEFSTVYFAVRLRGMRYQAWRQVRQERGARAVRASLGPHGSRSGGTSVNRSFGIGARHG
jgi:hypothetical protein